MSAVIFEFGDNIEPYKCSECGDICKLVEETFDYAGTHCTHGNSGTHKTGRWLSDCCLAEQEEE